MNEFYDINQLLQSQITAPSNQFYALILNASRSQIATN
jgi:hypothetical protein